MYAAQVPHPNIAGVPALPYPTYTSGMRLPLRREGRRRAHVLRGLWRIVLGRHRGGRVGLEDDIQLVIAAQDHVFPLGDGGQTNVGDGGFCGDLVGPHLPLLRQVEVFLMDVYTTGAARDGLLCDAHKRQARVYCHGMLKRSSTVVEALTLVELSAKSCLGGGFQTFGFRSIPVDKNALVTILVQIEEAAGLAGRGARCGRGFEGHAFLHEDRMDAE